MILRLFRGRAAVADAAEVGRQLSGPFLEAARAMPGLTSFAAAMRVDSDAVRVILASTWHGVADVARQTHGDLEAPAAPLPAFIWAEGTEHLELVSEPVVGSIVEPGAVVRFARMHVRQGREEEFYAIVRRGLRDITIAGDLLAYHLARRVREGHEAVALSVWRSGEALEALVPDSGSPLWPELEPVLDTFAVEHFDAVALIAG